VIELSRALLVEFFALHLESITLPFALLSLVAVQLLADLVPQFFVVLHVMIAAELIPVLTLFDHTLQLIGETHLHRWDLLLFLELFILLLLHLLERIRFVFECSLHIHECLVADESAILIEPRISHISKILTFLNTGNWIDAGKFESGLQAGHADDGIAELVVSLAELEISLPVSGLI
jgi:hypothetical protein